MIKFCTKYFLLILLLLKSLNIHALVVLQYHHISNDTPKSTSLSPELFKQHLDYLSDNHFQVLSLEQVILLLKSKQKLPDKAVLITFDDAYNSIYDMAYPLLKKKQFAFTVFVNSQSVNQENTTQMSWSQLHELSKNSAIIANHSVSHSHLTILNNNESKDDWKKRVTDEIKLAQIEIDRHLNTRVKAFAYPYGEFNAELKQILNDLGYIAFGQHSGAIDVDSDLLALPRFPMAGVYGSIDDFTLKINSLALPIAEVILEDQQGNRLKDHMLNRQIRKPYLKIKLKENYQSLDVNCYLSGEGQLIRMKTENMTIFHSSKELPLGRSRFNCTAKNAQDNRVYWFSQPWLLN